MTDYFTLDNDDATRYPESTQNENEFRTVIDAEIVDADEILDDAPGLDAPEPIRLIDEPMEDDTDEVDDNPVAALADTFPVQVKPWPRARARSTRKRPAEGPRNSRSSSCTPSNPNTTSSRPPKPRSRDTSGSRSATRKACRDGTRTARTISLPTRSV